ncbi:MAG: rod shape-determining protein MreD [Paracoccaceae bacterium]
MVEALRSSTWLYRAVFVGLAGALLFIKLLPLGSVAGDWPGPDILLCLVFAWVTRRPDFLPVFLIGIVVLMEDLILLRPPGLWAALVILASEFLRARVALTRELQFLTEWLLIAGLMLGLMIANRLALAIAFVPQPSLGFALLQTVWTILCYPLVVAVSRFAFDLRKPATGEVDAYGRRL